MKNDEQQHKTRSAQSSKRNQKRHPKSDPRGLGSTGQHSPLNGPDEIRTGGTIRQRGVIEPCRDSITGKILRQLIEDCDSQLASIQERRSQLEAFLRTIESQDDSL